MPQFKDGQKPNEISLCRYCQEILPSKDAFLKPGPVRSREKLKTVVKNATERKEKNLRLLANLSPLLQKIVTEKLASIGMIGDIIERAKTCPLCELIAYAIHDSAIEPPVAPYRSERHQIRLQWKTSYSPTFTEMQQMTVDPFAHSERQYLAIFHDRRELGTKLVPLANDCASPWAFARILTGLEGLVDVGKLQSWIGACERWHPGICGIDEKTQYKLPSIRLIDVVDNCLVKKYEKCRYIALSYQWGRCNTFQTSKENVACLEEKESLLTFTDKIPLTIRDAILLTRQLGERYLWVDALCIVQDDESNKMEAITNMDTVYHHALLTIIAGGGSDANAGLPGVRPRTRTFTQAVVQVQRDLRLTAVGSGVDFLKRSTYSTRAWTYQEAMLSRRTIIFINGEIFFRCRKTCWFENIDISDGRKTWRVPPSFGMPSSMLGLRWSTETPRIIAPAVLKFAKYASEMSSRQLTFSSDFLDAFQGISNVLCREINTTIFWGTPTAHFDLFLLWDTVEPALKRRVGFPSWSWAGWHGGIAWKALDETGFTAEKGSRLNPLLAETWIKWYRREEGGVRPIYIANERPDPKAAGFQTHHGKIHNLMQNKISSLVSPDFLGAIEYCQPSATALQAGKEGLNNQVLQFHTVSVHFRLSREPIKPVEKGNLGEAQVLAQTPSYSNQDEDDGGSSSQTAASDSRVNFKDVLIIDKNGRSRGVLSLTSATDWPDERLSGPPTSPASHEFIVLSGQALGSVLDSSPLGKDLWEPQISTEGGGIMNSARRFTKMLASMAIYKVMFIQWEDGIAYRAGLGYVYKSALDDALVAKQWKEILLG